MKRNMSTTIVIVSYSIVLIFTVTCIFLSCKGVTVPDILIEWVYKFFGLELVALSGIKISKHVGSAFGKAESAIDGTEPIEEEELNNEI